MKKTPFYARWLLFMSCAGWPVMVAAQGEVRVPIDPRKTRGMVSPYLFSQSLDYRDFAQYNSLWGEMIRNSTFAAAPAERGFYIQDDTLFQDAEGIGRELFFGDSTWRDYEFIFEAQKISGFEGFLVGFRVSDREHRYRYSFGSFRNSHYVLEKFFDSDLILSRSNHIAGSVATGHWYTIRVRCEGSHLRVWLDDQQVLDYTDNTNAVTNGGVSVGTWETQARFRNFKVTSLSGDTLFQGLPHSKTSVRTRTGSSNDFPLHWNSYGPVAFKRIPDSTEGTSYLELHPSSPPAGIQQGPLQILPRLIYHGALGVQATATTELVVRLRDSGGVLDEVKIAVPEGNQWMQIPFTFKPKTGSQNAWIQLEPQGKYSTHIRFFSLMPQMAQRLGGFDPDLTRAIAELRPSLLRWPGGIMRSRLSWQTLIGPHETRLAPSRFLWKETSTLNRMGPDEFLTFSQQVNATPVICLDIGRLRSETQQTVQTSLQESLQWLAYCNEPAGGTWGSLRRQNGASEPYDVRFWQLDYGVVPDLGFVPEGVSQYAYDYTELLNTFSERLRSADPQAKIIAGGYLGYTEDALVWIRTVLERSRNRMDYFDIRYDRRAYDFQSGPQATAQFLQTMRSLWSQFEGERLKLSLTGEMPAESDGRGEISAESNWHAGLHLGALMVILERNCDLVKMASLLPCIHYHENLNNSRGLINISPTGWLAGPGYAVYRLFHDHSGSQGVPVSASTGSLWLSATKEDGDGKLYIKTVNPTAESIQVVSLIDASFPCEKAHFWLIDEELYTRNTSYQPDAISPRLAPIQLQNQRIRWVSPPYSLGVVTIQRSPHP